MTGVSGITTDGGYTQSGVSTNTFTGATSLSNTFSQTGANTFSTGTGAISLNGATTISGSNTFTTGTGVSTFNSTSLVLAGNSTVLDMTGTGTLSLNTTTNRAITTGSGLFTTGGSIQIN